jgi:hypothetical protein
VLGCCEVASLILWMKYHMTKTTMPKQRAAK